MVKRKTLFLLLLGIGFGFFVETTCGVKALALGKNPLGHAMTEQDFFNALREVELVFAPKVKELGHTLLLQKNWESHETESSAALVKNQFVVTIPGGLARHPLMNIDSLTLAACHELGHLLGGAPKITVQGKKFWSSLEGQADYFSTSKCLRKIFTNRVENRAAFMSLNRELQEELKAKCKSYQCARIVAAGLHYVRFWESQMGLNPNSDMSAQIAKKDLNVAPHTLTFYSTTQCRLDTLMAGATCKISPDEDFDAVDAAAGACLEDSIDPEEALAARPACWFIAKEHLPRDYRRLMTK